MKQAIKLSGFILIFIGTLGLLVGEFAFDWGRGVTLVFAALDALGLAALAFTYWGMRKSS